MDTTNTKKYSVEHAIKILRNHTYPSTEITRLHGSAARIPRRKTDLTETSLEFCFRKIVLVSSVHTTIYTANWLS